ncbi:glucose transporter GlcP-like [Planococcus citri]|uniref:glucose transporter GlcP-like n=1 Tax=Planococcus citri TaxID=170843 RepID=UPI0031F8720B
MHKVPPEAIWSQIWALIPVFMNVFMMGAQNGWLPNAIYLILSGQAFHATAAECALMASFSEFGRIVFAIPAGILADKFGRKKMIICVAISHFFAWVGVSFSTSMVTIYMARFVLGIATALVNSTSLSSIGEIASPEIRGQLTSVYQIFMSVGVILPAIISAAFSLYNALAWGITFFSVINVLSLIWVTETPSFLISESKFKQAKQVLRQIRRGYRDSEIDTEFEKLKKYIEAEKANKNKSSLIQFFKSKSIRKPLITGVLINFFSIMTGGIILRVYSTGIYPDNEYVPKRFFPLINQILALTMALSTTFYIDKFSRRGIFIFGAVVMGSTNAICAFTNYFYLEQNIEYIFKWVFVIGNLLSVLCYGATIQPMNSAIKSELYPQVVKGLCGSLGVISQASSTVLSYQLFNIIKNHFHIYFMYVVLSMNCAILGLIVYFLLPEGRGASLTDVQMQFQEEPAADCDSVTVKKYDQK